MPQKDKAEAAEYCRLRKERRISEARAFLGGECAACGETENLQFDHIDPLTKLFNVTHGARSVGEAKFWAEVRKCQLLCKPHHEAKTGKERNGEGNPFSKLTELDVLTIRALSALGHSQSQIGRMFEVSGQHVGKIVRRERWRTL